MNASPSITPACDSVRVPPRAALRFPHPASHGAIRQTQSHGGTLGSSRSPPVYDAWERRLLKQQYRAAAMYRSSPSTGYSRGPELLKAYAELKSRSHS